MTNINKTAEPSPASVGSHNPAMATARLSAANTWLQEEIKRLRLTDAERQAIAAGLGALERLYEDSPPISRPIYEQHAPTLRNLLERLT